MTAAGAAALGVQLAEGGHGPEPALTQHPAAPCPGNVREPPPAAHAATRSGLPWPSGAWTEISEQCGVQAFFAWRGRAGDVAVQFASRHDPRTIPVPDWPVEEWAGWPGRLSIAFPLYPEQGSMRACADGRYDDQWRAVGAYLVSRGRGDSFVRPGWEPNGDWFWWRAADAETYKACFRRVVQALRSGDPAVVIDWTIAAHAQEYPRTGNALDLYPGDAFVDVVGIDAYDWAPPSRDQRSWTAQASAANGIEQVIWFARQHGKKFSVPEWGVSSTADGGGDNPFYVQKMYETFSANRDVLAYEAYFNSSEPGNVRSSIFGQVLNPRAAAEYRRLFGPGA